MYSILILLCLAKSMLNLYLLCYWQRHYKILASKQSTDYSNEINANMVYTQKDVK